MRSSCNFCTIFCSMICCFVMIAQREYLQWQWKEQHKKNQKKISVLPSPRPHCPNYYWYYKKDEKKKERQNQKTKKLPVHISMSQTVPKKIYKKQSLLDLDIRPEVKKRKTFKKRCIIKATKFEIKTNTNDVTKQSPVRIPCFLKKKTTSLFVEQGTSE